MFCKYIMLQQEFKYEMFHLISLRQKWRLSASVADVQFC